MRCSAVGMVDWQLLLSFVLSQRRTACYQRDRARVSSQACHQQGGDPGATAGRQCAWPRIHRPIPERASARDGLLLSNPRGAAGDVAAAAAVSDGKGDPRAAGRLVPPGGRIPQALLGGHEHAASRAVPRASPRVRGARPAASDGSCRARCGSRRAGPALLCGSPACSPAGPAMAVRVRRPSNAKFEAYKAAEYIHLASPRHQMLCRTFSRRGALCHVSVLFGSWCRSTSPSWLQGLAPGWV